MWSEVSLHIVNPHLIVISSSKYFCRRLSRCIFGSLPRPPLCLPHFFRIENSLAGRLCPDLRFGYGSKGYAGRVSDQKIYLPLQTPSDTWYLLFRYMRLSNVSEKLQARNYLHSPLGGRRYPQPHFTINASSPFLPTLNLGKNQGIFCKKYPLLVQPYPPISALLSLQCHPLCGTNIP